MIYPGNFEAKTGFDRIRALLKDNCLSTMGSELIEEMKFMTDLQPVDARLSETFEFQQLLLLEDSFPSEDYFEISGCLNKIRIEGHFLRQGKCLNSGAPWRQSGQSWHFSGGRKVINTLFSDRYAAM